MKIDLSCPAEVWRYELPKKDYPACDLMLYNLSEKIITSVEVTVLFLNKEQEEVERLIYRAHDLDGRPSTAFSVTVPKEDAGDATSLEVMIDKIWFSDASVWRRGKYALSEYTPNNLPNSRSLEMLRYVAGSNAVGFPQKQENLWICVCGRPNGADERTCARCHREREQVFTRFNREAIEKLTSQREHQLALQAKAAREDASRLQLQREKVYEAKKKKRRKVITIVVSCAAVAGIAYGSVFHLVPYIRYRNAVSAMEQGKYEEARSVFLAMSGYQDADANEKQCRYLQAKASLMEDADEDTLLAARSEMVELGDYEDAADQVTYADWLHAEWLLKADKVDDAAALYTALGDYRNSADRLTECTYLKAKKQLESGDYDTAYATFLALGDYEDAPDLAKECIYRPAVQLMENGGAGDAIAQFERIPGYSDADEKLKEAHYLYGKVLVEAGRTTDAGNQFLAAGDYNDAKDLANTYLYLAAEEAYGAGEYQTAAELYIQIADYEDAQDKYNQCALTIAQNAMKDREYQIAAAWLTTLPDTYSDVLDLRQECIYRPALSALSSKDYQSAVDGFSRISTYRDSSDRLEQARYGLAAQKVTDGLWSEAVELYTLLGEYKDSPDLLQEARYGLGLQQLAQEQWQQAAATFTALGDYQESADKLKEAQYHLALAAYDEKDYATARSMFEALGAYSDAAEQIKACDYALADMAAGEGKTAEAAQLFASLGDYSDAKDRAGALYYTLGEKAVENGQILSAARMYAKASGYQDADALAAQYYDAYYQEAAENAQKAMEAQEYDVAAALLGHMDLTELPEKYGNLDELYLEANYQQANKLYGDGQVYAALPYYRRIPDYKDVAQKLQRTCYLILGTWQTADGSTYLFRADGTCALEGEELYFRAETYALYTGATVEELTQTYSVSNIDATTMTLRDAREGVSRTLRLTKVAEAEVAEVAEPDVGNEGVEETEASEPTPTVSVDFLVVDDET